MKSVHLKGESVDIRYRMQDLAQESIVGVVTGRAVSVSGSAIEVHELSIGRLVVLTILPSDRAGREFKFCFFIPEVSDTDDLVTLGVVVTNREAEVGKPLGGPSFDYKPVMLQGNVGTTSAG